MLIDHAGFARWMDDYRMTLDFASKIFGVTRRTVTRWRNSGRISRAAAQMIRVIDLQAAPWTASFWRGARVGLSTLVWQWRNELFAPPGGVWQDYRTAAETRRAAAHRKRCEAWRQAEAERKRLADLARARKAATTRRARAAAARAAQATPAPAPLALALLRRGGWLQGFAGGLATAARSPSMACTRSIASSA